MQTMSRILKAEIVEEYHIEVIVTCWVCHRCHHCFNLFVPRGYHQHVGTFAIAVYL